MALIKRPFSKVEKAEIGGGPREPFLRPKNIRRDLSQPEDSNIVSSERAWYAVRIEECEFKETRNSGDMFKAKLMIVASEGGEGTNEVGSIAAFAIMASSDGFDRDMKTFICTANNMNPETLTESYCERVISKEQPLVGKFVKVFVENSKTKKRNKDFTKHEWSPLVFANGGLNVPAIDEVAQYVARERAKTQA